MWDHKGHQVPKVIQEQKVLLDLQGRWVLLDLKDLLVPQAVQDNLEAKDNKVVLVQLDQQVLREIKDHLALVV